MYMYTCILCILYTSIEYRAYLYTMYLYKNVQIYSFQHILYTMYDAQARVTKIIEAYCDLEASVDKALSHRLEIHS